MESAMKSLQLSYGRCASSPLFFKDFYDNFFNSSPLIKQKFIDTDMDAQRGLLRHGLSHLIMYAGGSHAAEMKVDRLAHSHSKTQLDIQPWMYDYWIKALMTTVKMHDRKFDESLSAIWEGALKMGIEKMIKAH
ncbi:globin [Reichenbachiella agarivorans]|uniref:Globin n=1 Tax=Reichenbachiella agarivorans TaxID=2979464 RepID=A0ABY6CT69_9BACT|nr:globin [Reichenbachiella agarivorans]UXP33190.1 globin [Reichenbachiella agarivorans]